MLKKEKFFLFFLVSLVLAGSSFLPIKAKQKEERIEWEEIDDLKYDKEQGYEYVISKDKKYAKIFYHFAEKKKHLVKKLEIPEKIKGYTVIALGDDEEVKSTESFVLEDLQDVVEEIVIPDTICHISCGAFANLRKLKKINLPDWMTEIPDDLFYGCESLEEITLPPKIKKIGVYAFSECSSLKKIKIPDSVTTIKLGAFCFAYELEEIEFSKNLKKIEDTAFDETAWLEKQRKEGKDFVLINDNILYRCYSKEDIVEIPEGIEMVAEQAFCEVIEAKEIWLPKTMKKIDKSDMGTPNLERIYLKGDAPKIVEDSLPITLEGSLFIYERDPQIYYVKGGKGYKKGLWKRMKVKPKPYEKHEITIQLKKGKTEKEEVYTGQKIEEPKIERENFFIDYWTDGEKKFSFETVIEKDYTLYPVWKKGKK